MKAETFQDPSMQMKRALLRSLMIAAVAVVLYMFCVEPRQSALQKARGELDQLKGQQAQRARNMKEVGQTKARLDAVNAERQKYLDGLLKPPIGDSYHMGARELLEPLANTNGVSTSDYSQLLIRRLPLPKPQPPQLYARMPIRLTCTGTYMDIISFLQHVEKDLPLVSLEAFSLQAQKGPDEQSAAIVFEWPVKVVEEEVKK